MFFFLPKHADDAVFNDFPKISGYLLADLCLVFAAQVVVQ